ncbi:MAG: hypothetical protein AAFX00_10930, partial [Pseudomonadota bacterium]
MVGILDVAPRPQARGIRYSVVEPLGHGALNAPEDVLLVQYLLRIERQAKTGARIPLDGIWGSLT